MPRTYADLLVSLDPVRGMSPRRYRRQRLPKEARQLLCECVSTLRAFSHGC
jgi:hypothetical protein